MTNKNRHNVLYCPINCHDMTNGRVYISMDENVSTLQNFILNQAKRKVV